MTRACFASLALLALSGPALAQEAPAPTAQQPVVPSMTITRDTSHVRASLAGASADMSLRDSLRYPERAERAERLAALAHSGECRTAYRVALRESDKQMTANLARMCELPARDVFAIRRLSVR